MKKRNTFLKRIGAMILVIAMIVTLAPTTAFARTTEESDAHVETVADDAVVHTDETAAAEAGAAIGDAAGSETAAETEAPGEGSGIRNGVETVDVTAAPEDETAAEEATEAENPAETEGEETTEVETPEETPEETTEAESPQETGEETTEAETPEETTEAETPEETIPEETEAPLEETMPEVTLRARANDVNVTMEAPVGAFPAGTRMEAHKVVDENVLNQIRDAVEGYVYEIRAVDIQFFDAEGNEIEPQAPIRVSLVSDVVNEDSSVVVHVPDEEDGVQAPAEVVEQAVITENRAEFVSEEFSVYAVVQTGTDARVLILFLNPDGSEIERIYVKKGDDFNQVIHDPSTGSIPEGAEFRGWTTDGNYGHHGEEDTGEITAAEINATVTIGEIRDIFRQYTNDDWEEVTDGDSAEGGTVYRYYAMVAKEYTINYFDEFHASLGQDVITFREDASAERVYSISRNYTPYLETESFLGWMVTAGKESINGYTEGTLYNYGNQITITGDVTFSVDAPEGYWLVFDENGRGGTYNAPRFYLPGDEISNEGLLDMVRYGYTFGGWYDTKEHADAHAANTSVTTGAFSFEGTLTEDTTIYASWIPNTRSNYTIIIWKQNIAGDGYDFVRSIVVENAIVGSTINAVTPQGNGARINGTNFSYTGFHLGEYDQGVKVKTEGNAVVNVHFDRNESTLQFQVQDYVYTSTTSNSNNVTQYGLVNGQYVQLTRHGRGTWNNPYYWTYGNNTTYNGTRYTRNYQWTTIKEITALYQQPIGENFPIEGTNGVTYNNGERWDPQSTAGANDVIVYIDIMPAQGDTYRLNVVDDRPLKTMNWYVAALPTDTNTVAAPDTLYNYDNNAITPPSGTRYVLYNSISARYNGVTIEDFLDLAGFERLGADSQRENGFYIYDEDHDGTINFYYTRNNYNIVYMDGVYVDGNGNILDEENRGELNRVTGISYNADLSTYNSGGENGYEPTPPRGFVFEGWYIDSACSDEHPYTFNRMPEGGITVYAKWRQIQYRVFLHPNAGTDSTLNWGSDSQTMNFRVSYDGQVSAPTGLRSNYTFVGWYLDPECRGNMFDPAFHRVNESLSAGLSEYDQTTDFTDPMDKWGNIGENPTNSDALENRTWITQRLDLYALWRPALDGADGIGILYDLTDPDIDGHGNPGTGSGGETDSRLYTADATAYAVAGPSRAPEGYRFDHWVMQQWVEDDDHPDGAFVDTNDPVIYAGGPFTVLASYAQDEDTGEYKTDEEGHYLDRYGRITENEEDYVIVHKYTIRLRAEYSPIIIETPTHITWFQNYASDNYWTHRDPEGSGTLSINEAVAIQGARTRAGYEFIGWARVEADSEEQIAAWETQGPVRNLTASDLYLFYNASDQTFHLDSTTGRTVSQVAADEETPYHAMFAVWAPVVSVEVTGSSIERSYTGSPQSNDGFAVVVTVGDTEYVVGTDTLPEGITCAVTATQNGQAVNPIAATGTNVGTYTAAVTATVALAESVAGNYVLETATDSDDVVLNITPVAITIAANDKTKPYDNDPATDPALTATVTGVPENGVAPDYSL
ncbi:MAG: InlB B-repeat-containing protein, partial [Lachnospiraceae bacterium]|nr:InlB B-repeat-containing protein [Lachnospiraceae bacterium]